NATGQSDGPNWWTNCTQLATNVGLCVGGTWPNCDAAAGTANNEARLQYWALGNGTRAPYAGVKYLGGAVVYLNDRVNPTLQWSGDPAPSDGWTNSDGPFALLAQDSGLGVKTVTISSPSTPGWAGATLDTGCNGTRFDRAAGRCTNPQTLNYSTSGLPEGPQTLHAVATDAVGNQSSPIDYSVK